MGGCEYLESRIDATEYGELLPTVDDAVCGLLSIMDAMNTGDNDRFHLETLHHSKEEIQRILERGGKVDRTVKYVVDDDEDDEYEQYHGFNMRTIILPKSVADILRRRKAEALSQWIFPDPVKPEDPVNPDTAYHHMKTLLQRAGLPSIRFHDMRHTFATHALTSGVDAKTLSGILGHTNASFTLDTYTHVTSDMQKQASSIVGGFMEDLFGKELKPWQENAKQETGL